LVHVVLVGVGGNDVGKMVGSRLSADLAARGPGRGCGGRRRAGGRAALEAGAGFFGKWAGVWLAAQGSGAC
jgi:hypothetical protein